MRVLIRVTVLLMLVIGLSENSYAQTYPVMQPPTVRPVVSFDSTTKLFTYSYMITNNPQSTARIFSFELDIARRDRASVPRVDDLNSSAVTYVEGYKRMLNRIQNLVVPAALQSAPKGWRGELGVGQYLGFSGLPDIPPGTTQGPFVIVSYGMVGARNFSVEHFIDWRDLPDPNAALPDYDAFKRIIRQDNAIIDAAKFTGPTIGPVGPPVNCDVACLVGFLISEKEQAAQLGWIDNEETAERLDKKLKAVKDKLQEGETRTAGNILHSFIHDLQAQHRKDDHDKDRDRDKLTHDDEEDRGKHVSDNAFFLLKPNAEFILSKLGHAHEEENDKGEKNK